MRIELTEEQKLLQETVRRFAEEVARPRAKEIDESGEFPRPFFDQAGELGLAGVSVPEEYGDARLQKAVARAADSRTAREIRDAVLGDLSNFKGDYEQVDDITVVVVRVR